jgi:amino acid permease
MFSYPLQVHPCRASVDAVLKWRWKRNPDNGPNSSPSRNALLAGTRATKARTDVMSDTRFALITTVIIVLSYFVAMTVSSLSRVLAYVGSTGSTSISFILPGLFYYKISSPDSALHQKLMKEDDDEGDGEEREGLLAGAGAVAESPLARITGILGGAAWRKGLTRRLALALSIYGMVVMVVCLVTNTLFVAGH